MVKKYEIHVPVEQYGFISCTMEGEVHEAVQEYKDIARTFNSTGIPEKDWRALLDEYLTTKQVKNGGDIWGDLSDFQKNVINEIKKSFKRTI